jgi:hypothetical protein
MFISRFLFPLVVVWFTIFFTPDSSGQIKIKAVGDIMLGSLTPKEILPLKKGKEFIESAGNLLTSSDIVFGNLEGAFIIEGMKPKKCSERSRKRATCYEFGMPVHLALTLKELGFNVINQDNNHSEDYGYEGYRFTQERLQELGIRFVPKKGYAEFEIDSLSISVVAFGYSENSNNISDLEHAKTIISGLQDRFDRIIVSFHGGAEGKDAVHVKDSTETYLGENRGNVYAFAHNMIDAGADMVIGHGPHVLRALEIYKNKLIAYSLGNFLTYGNMNIGGINGVSVVLEAEIDDNTGDFIRGKLISINQVGYGIPVPDETNEGYYLIKKLTNKDIRNSHLLFIDSERVYNSEIISPPIKPIKYHYHINSIVEILKKTEENLKKRDYGNYLKEAKYKKPTIK